jgi:hypothetical protein
VALEIGPIGFWRLPGRSDQQGKRSRRDEPERFCLKAPPGSPHPRCEGHHRVHTQSHEGSSPLRGPACGARNPLFAGWGLEHAIDCPEQHGELSVNEVDIGDAEEEFPLEHDASVEDVVDQIEE